jgi:hypothetical protein
MTAEEVLRLTTNLVDLGMLVREMKGLRINNTTDKNMEINTVVLTVAMVPVADMMTTMKES